MQIFTKEFHFYNFEMLSQPIQIRLFVIVNNTSFEIEV